MPFHNHQSLDHFYQSHFRFYDPKMGRFMAADTIVPNPANGEAFNRYAYTYNNPVKFKDPSGHTPNDWLKMAWEKITSSLGWGEDSSSYTSYGYSQEAFFYEMATEKINPRGVAQGVAGAAVATREVEFKSGAAYLGGMADFEYYFNPLFASDYMRGNPAPSEEVFEIVALDMANQPGYKIPYGLGIATGMVTVVLPTSAALGRLRLPRRAPQPRPRAQPTPENRRAPQFGEPGYPPVVVGGNHGSPGNFGYEDLALGVAEKGFLRFKGDAFQVMDVPYTAGDRILSNMERLFVALSRTRSLSGRVRFRLDLDDGGNIMDHAFDPDAEFYHSITSEELRYVRDNVPDVVYYYKGEEVTPDFPN